MRRCRNLSSEPKAVEDSAQEHIRLELDRTVSSASSASTVDITKWLFEYKDIELIQAIGEGSYAHVRMQARRQLGALLSPAWPLENIHAMVLHPPGAGVHGQVARGDGSSEGVPGGGAADTESPGSDAIQPKDSRPAEGGMRLCHAFLRSLTDC